MTFKRSFVTQLMIELATSAMVLFSMLYGVAGASTKPADMSANKPSQAIEDASIIDGKALIAPVGGKISVEDEVRNYFKDTPILAQIAECESRFRQIDKNGDVLRGTQNPDDIGVMQINTFYHKDEAEKQGINISTLSGNMKYAKILYEKYGTTPWKPSSACWQKYEKIAKR